MSRWQLQGVMPRCPVLRRKNKQRLAAGRLQLEQLTRVLLSSIFFIADSVVSGNLMIAKASNFSAGGLLQTTPAMSASGAFIGVHLSKAEAKGSSRWGPFCYQRMHHCGQDAHARAAGTAASGLHPPAAASAAKLATRPHTRLLLSVCASPPSRHTPRLYLPTARLVAVHRWRLSTAASTSRTLWPPATCPPTAIWISVKLRSSPLARVLGVPGELERLRPMEGSRIPRLAQLLEGAPRHCLQRLLRLALVATCRAVQCSIQGPANLQMVTGSQSPRPDAHLRLPDPRRKLHGSQPVQHSSGECSMSRCLSPAPLLHVADLCVPTPRQAAADVWSCFLRHRPIPTGSIGAAHALLPMRNRSAMRLAKGIRALVPLLPQRTNPTANAAILQRARWQRQRACRHL